MRARRAALTVVVGLLAAACGSSPAAGSSSKSDTSPSATAVTPSSGQQSCATQTQPPGTPGTFVQSNGGTTFTLSFDGCAWTLIASSQSGAPITGSWTYSAATLQISFTETAGLCGPPTGTYRWALSGSSLTMTTVSDPCAARATQFDGHVWTRQP